VCCLSSNLEHETVGEAKRGALLELLKRRGNAITSSPRNRAFGGNMYLGAIVLVAGREVFECAVVPPQATIRSDPPGVVQHALNLSGPAVPVGATDASSLAYGSENP
jgi:hypothetical protein